MNIKQLPLVIIYLAVISSNYSFADRKGRASSSSALKTGASVLNGDTTNETKTRPIAEKLNKEIQEFDPNTLPPPSMKDVVHASQININSKPRNAQSLLLKKQKWLVEMSDTTLSIQDLNEDTKNRPFVFKTNHPFYGQPIYFEIHVDQPLYHPENHDFYDSAPDKQMLLFMTENAVYMLPFSDSLATLEEPTLIIELNSNLKFKNPISTFKRGDEYFLSVTDQNDIVYFVQITETMNISEHKIFNNRIQHFENTSIEFNGDQYSFEDFQIGQNELTVKKTLKSPPPPSLFSKLAGFFVKAPALTEHSSSLVTLRIPLNEPLTSNPFFYLDHYNLFYIGYLTENSVQFIDFESRKKYSYPIRDYPDLTEKNFLDKKFPFEKSISGNFKASELEFFRNEAGTIFAVNRLFHIESDPTVYRLHTFDSAKPSDQTPPLPPVLYRSTHPNNSVKDLKNRNPAPYSTLPAFFNNDNESDF